MNRKMWFVLLSVLFLSSCIQVISGYAIEKAPEGGDGEVGIIQVNGPPGIQIQIDNSSGGVIPQSGVLVIPNVRGGSRQLLAMREGHPSEPYYAEVFVNQTAVVEISPESRYGDLMVTSTPLNVKVFLDMRYKGVTPLSLTNLDVEGYKLTLQLEGYQDWEQDIMIKPGGKETISAVLMPNVPSPTAPVSKTPGFTISLACLALICMGLWFEGKKRKP